MTRPILTVPHDVLRAVCAPVTAFDADLAALTEEMFAAMYAAPGRGLAAPQIGVARRLFVMDATWKTGDRSPRICVNPEIVAQSEGLATHEEACLSIPRIAVTVDRPEWVTLRWQDLAGTVQEETFSGTEAVIVQHERDHLDGILCTDYATLP
ncbi:peptide deformylase [Loktanella atrilutea]|uniref:Peptide deformylase n=1 Tax=Loktanella atrilutea TaxID=366533 RepID=A0A1M4WKU0_LOKAT|nr:peptide deformylase [Loktanella atrilutea]SHE81825.1 peptide deformylase [Loktanella atrilutea]